jgi:triacylglycerol lipase
MTKQLRIKTIGIVVCSVLLAAFMVKTAAPSGPLPVLKHDPILFVHGYLGNNGNWQQMEDRFRADGWQDVELYAYNYSFINSNASSAVEIRDQVDKIITTTGATKVDIIAFSMGSISSRYYLKNLGGAGKIDAWVSLAGPNHGTTDVENQDCQTTPCNEIIPGSAFLGALNAIDETPGLVRYATWRSNCDATIIPTASVILSGATNNVIACIDHLGFLTDATVYAQVRNFVE